MADWLDIGSDELDSSCGSSFGYTINDPLDGTSYWVHSEDHTHWFILDLGETYTLTKVRGRSNMVFDPTDIDIYVSDSKEDWGDAVVDNITNWQDTSSFQEHEFTQKNGRYIKVNILDTESSSDYIQFGQDFTIFDAYGELPSSPSVKININAIGTIELGSDLAIDTEILGPDLYIDVVSY